MSLARFNRTLLVWESANYCIQQEYTAEEFNSEFTAKQRKRLLDGHMVNGCVDLEAFYHRVSALVPA